MMIDDDDDESCTAGFNAFHLYPSSHPSTHPATQPHPSTATWTRRSDGSGGSGGGLLACDEGELDHTSLEAAQHPQSGDGALH